MADIPFVNLVDDSPSSTDTDEAHDVLTTSFTGGGTESYSSKVRSNDETELVITHETHALDGSTEISNIPRKRKYTGWAGIQINHAKPRLPAAEDKENDSKQTEPQNATSVREAIACPTQSLGEEWQLSYWRPPGIPRPKFWTYELYRGKQGKPIKVSYCNTLATCEDTARLFEREPILGFDMEWKSHSRRPVIQDNVSLIQVAAEGKIALFHIAMIPGSTSTDVIAPTLRKIIESPEQRKCGVAVNTADGNRLRQYLDLQPRGMFELRDFHRLVCEATSTKGQSIGLAGLTAFYLGSPLSKGPVRTSDWTRALTEEQSRYAANDSYAGFRIFHAMNAKRLKMAHPPPIPAHTELGMAKPELVSGNEYKPRSGKRSKKQSKRARLSDRRRSNQEPEEPPALARPTTFRIPPELPRELQTGPVQSSHTFERAQHSPSPVRRSEPSVRSTKIFNMLWARRRQLAIRSSMKDEELVSDGDLRQVADTLPRTPSELEALPACAAFARRWDVDVLALVNSVAPASRDRDE